jgi:hypothetical protein
MLIDWTLSYNPISYPMDDSVIGVWFKKKRCPIELNCGIVFLSKYNNRENKRNKTMDKIMVKCSFGQLFCLICDFRHLVFKSANLVPRFSKYLTSPPPMHLLLKQFTYRIIKIQLRNV